MVVKIKYVDYPSIDTMSAALCLLDLHKVLILTAPEFKDIKEKMSDLEDRHELDENFNEDKEYNELAELLFRNVLNADAVESPDVEIGYNSVEEVNNNLEEFAELIPEEDQGEGMFSILFEDGSDLRLNFSMDTGTSYYWKKRGS